MLQDLRNYCAIYIEGEGTFESPAKRYKRSRKEVVDDFDEEGIQKAIYAMYNMAGQNDLTSLSY